MRKKMMLTACIMISILAAGCQKQAEETRPAYETATSAQESTEAAAEETEASEETTAETEATEETAPLAVRQAMVDNFEPSVFTDGVPRKLVYYMDTEKQYYDEFVNINLPEYGYTSISIPTDLVDKFDNKIVLEEGDPLPDWDVLRGNTVVNSSAYYSTDEVAVYSLETYLYWFQVWKTAYDKTIDIDTEKISDVADMLIDIPDNKWDETLKVFTGEYVVNEMLEDGSRLIALDILKQTEYSEDRYEYRYAGRWYARLKEGVARCGMFAKGAPRTSEGVRYAKYVFENSAIVE